MSGRSALPPARAPRIPSVRPAGAARGATGARGLCRDLVRTAGGLGRLLLLGVGFGLALVLCATAVLNSRQTDAGGDSRLIVPGAWAAEETPPSEADRRAAERDAELDRARREADQASAEAALGDPAKESGPRYADDDHGPAVGGPPESREPHRSPEDAAATKPAEPDATEEPAPSERRESTRPPRTTPPASEPTREPTAPRESREPTASPKPVPTRPSASPTEPDPTPSASTRPSTRPSSSNPPDDDDDECTIKLLGLCL